MDRWLTALSTIQQTPSPWWHRLLRQRHGYGKSASPTPGSLFGRGRARAMCKGFIGHLRPRCILYYIYFYCRSIRRPKRWDGVPPRAPPPTRLHSNTPPTTYAAYRVDCWLSSSIGGHLRPRPCLPLYFLMRLALALQSTEQATVRAHRTTCACFRPIGSGSAKI